MLADVRFESFEAGLIARIRGEIDMSNADAIGGALRQTLTNDQLGLVLDLTDVDYLDSAGIHLIYDLRESLRVRGQQLRLVVPERSSAVDALMLAGVLQSLDVDRSVEAAAEVVRARA
jgi:anti-sigma B factor antagonist